MKISICIPVMGREQMLVQALLSILPQEHKDYEVVIRDDDPTHPVTLNADVNWAFGLFKGNLRYCLGEHLGDYGKVCNATLEFAQGDVLYMMGSDDLLAPNALYSVNEAFESERFGGPCWVYGRTMSVDSHLQYLGVDGEEVSYEQMLKHNRFGQPATFWNRQLYNLSGPFDPRYKYACDYEMWLRFWRIKAPLFLPYILGIYRHHDEQMSVTKRKGLEDEARRASERHQVLGDVVEHARTFWLAKKTGEIPQAHD